MLLLRHLWVPIKISEKEATFVASTKKSICPADKDNKLTHTSSFQKTANLPLIPIRFMPMQPPIWTLICILSNWLTHNLVSLKKTKSGSSEVICFFNSWNVYGFPSFWTFQHKHFIVHGGLPSKPHHVRGRLSSWHTLTCVNPCSTRRFWRLNMCLVRAALFHNHQFLEANVELGLAPKVKTPGLSTFKLPTWWVTPVIELTWIPFSFFVGPFNFVIVILFESIVRLSLRLMRRGSGSGKPCSIYLNS